MKLDETEPVRSWRKEGAGKPAKTVVLLGVLLPGLFWGLYSLGKGPTFSQDSWDYVNAADYLLAHGFNLFTLPHFDGFDNGFLYYNWLVILAGGKALMGEQWPWFILAFNLLTAILTMVLVSNLVLEATGNHWAVLFSGALFMAAFDFLLWIPFLHPDVAYAFLVFLLFWVWNREWSDAWIDRALKVLIPGLIVIIAFFFRPTASPLVAAFLAYLSLRPLLVDRSHRFKPHRARIILLLLTVSAVVVSFFWAIPMVDPGAWPMDYFQKFIIKLSGEYQMGMVVHQRPETYISPPESPAGFALITWTKTLHFFQITAQGYSPGHQLLNILFFGPAYLLAGVAASFSLRKGGQMSDQAKQAVFWALLLIASMAFFHGATLIDFDFRYRIPILPILVFLAGVGFHQTMGVASSLWGPRERA